MLYSTRITSHVVDMLVSSGARRATKFVTPKFVVRATIRRDRRRIPTKGTVEISLTIGRPNFAERRFIKALKKTGEPFPVKKIKLTFPAKRKR